MRRGRPKGAEALGIHLEGPYINTLRRGAHQTSVVAYAQCRGDGRLLSIADGHLRLIPTVAPELDGSEALIQRMTAAGVGEPRTRTGYEQAVAAIELGVRTRPIAATPCRALHHRDPGPLPAIGGSSSSMGEIIADGVHVHPRCCACSSNSLAQSGASSSPMRWRALACLTPSSSSTGGVRASWVVSPSLTMERSLEAC